MRPSKLKLSAVVLSAIMAIGTMTTTSFADELIEDEVAVEVVEETVEETAAVLADAETVVDYKLDSTSLEWMYDKETEKVTVTYHLKASDNKSEDLEKTAEATIVSTTAASYTADGTVDAKVTIQGSTFTRTLVIENKKTSSEYLKETVVTKVPTCTEDGEEIVMEYNVVPGTELDANGKIPSNAKIGKGTQVGDPVVLPASGEHTWVKTVTKIEAGDNTKIVDGKPVLLDPYKNGEYIEYISEKCSVCGAQRYDEDPKEYIREVASTMIDYEATKIIDSKNITKIIGTDKAEYSTEVEGEKKGGIGLKMENIPTDLSKIYLKNCTEDGKYELAYYTYANTTTPAMVKWVTVKAHHVETYRISAKKSSDDEFLTKDLTNGTATSKLCNRSIAYYLYTDCAVCGKNLSKAEKTAAASETHTIDPNTKAAFKDDVVYDFDVIGSLIKNAATKHVKVSDLTANCKTAGTVKITYLCMICGKEVETVTRNVAKHDGGPIEGTPELVTIEEPTCTTEGKAVRVVKCAYPYCNAELSRTEVTVDKLKHTNETASPLDKNAILNLSGEIVVGVSYPEGILRYQSTWSSSADVSPYLIGYDTAFGVTAEVYTLCANCGYKMNVGRPKIEIVEVKENDVKTGAPGSITIKATYITTETKDAAAKTLEATKTVPYYNSVVAYMDRDTGIDIKNGLVKDQDGVWRLYQIGQLADSFTGIYSYDGGQFFITNGVLDSSANGLNLYNGVWYFLSNGQIQRGHDGFALYNGEWFIIENGELNTEANGLYDYDGGKFLFAAGRLRKDVSGLWQNSDGKWYFLANGQVVDYTGVAEYDGSFFYIEKGILATSYNGTVDYDGAKFNVVAGQLYDKVA